MKRILGLALALCMIVSIVPVAFAAEYQLQDLSTATWQAYEDCGSGAEGNRASSVTALTNEQTGHGAGVMVSKPITKDEFTNFKFVKTGTVTLPTPVSIEEGIKTSIEFWYRVNDKHEGWITTALLVNDEHVFGITDNMTYGRPTGDQYLYGLFSDTYTANEWVNIKLELRPSTYHPWVDGREDTSQNLPCTSVATYKRASADASWEEQPVGGGRILSAYDEITSISTGIAYFNPNIKPAEDISGSIDISVAGLKVYQDVSITADGWRGFNQVNYTGIWNDGTSTSTQNVQSDFASSSVVALTNEQTGHGAGVKATKQVSANEWTSFKTMPIAIKEFSEPVAVDSSKKTIMEFWMNAEGLAQSEEGVTQDFANAHVFINNDAYFSILGDGRVGFRELNYSSEWSTPFNDSFVLSEGEWVKVKLEMISGTKEVEGSTPVPCTKVVTSVKKNEEDAWTTFNEQSLRVNHTDIKTVALGYSTNYNKNALYNDAIDISLADLKIYREGGDQPPVTPDPPVVNTWQGYENIEGITSESMSSTVTELTDADTGHGDGVTAKKAFDANESSNGFKKLATYNLETPVTIGEEKTFVEFWYKANGANQEWANSIIMINDEPMFSVANWNAFGAVSGVNNIEWYRFNKTYPTNEWIHVKVELNQGKYQPWATETEEEMLPATIVFPIVTMPDGSTDQPWRRDCRFGVDQTQINSISIAYQSSKTPTQANEGITNTNASNAAWNEEHKNDADFVAKPTDTPLIATSGDLEISLADLKIYREGEEPVDPPGGEDPVDPPGGDDPVVNEEWQAYDIVQRRDKDADTEDGKAIYHNIQSESMSSRVVSLSDEETGNHGEGIKVSKTVDPSEWLQFSFAKLATKTFAEPLTVTDSDVTTIEYWTKVEGRSQTAEVEGVETTVNWGLSHFFINDEPVVGMLSSGQLGQAGPDWGKGYCNAFRWGDAYKIPDGVWAKFKLEFKNGVYDRTQWDETLQQHVVVEENVPCTKMKLSVMAEEGVEPDTEADKWQDYGEIVLRDTYNSIESISFGYSKDNAAPITTSDLDIYVAGLSINGVGGVPEVNPDIYGGWYGYANNANISETGVDGKTSVVNKGTDGENSAHPDYITVKKPVYTNEDIWYNYVKLGTTQLAAPVTISTDENKPTRVEMWMKASNISDWGNAVIFINDQPFTGISNSGGIGYASMTEGWFCYMGNQISIGDDEWVKFAIDLFQSEGETRAITNVKKNEADQWIPENDTYGAPGTKHLPAYQETISSISVGYRQSGGSDREKPDADCVLQISVDGLKIDGMDAHEMLSVAKSGSDVTATYALRAFAPTQQDVKVVLAVYDSNDVLLGTQMSEASEIKFTGVDSTAGTAKTISSSVALPDNAAYVRAYAWDSAAGMKAIIEPTAPTNVQ